MTVLTHRSGHELGGRLDAVGWGLLFLVSGVLLLVPDAPAGSWLASVGAILLAMSAAKWALGVGVSWLIAIIGAVGLVTGLGEMAGYEVPGLSLLLILCGTGLIGAQLLRRGSE